MNISPLRLKNTLNKAKSAHREKPYIRKLCNFLGFKVWIVDGEYIRKNMCEDFVSFDEHYGLNFIPKDEFWVEENNIHNEEKYYLERMFVENKLASSGVPFKKAFEIALKVEKSERAKSGIAKWVNGKNNKEIVKRVYKRLLSIKSGKLKIWLVRGDLVRDFFPADYSLGGHDKVYPFIPKNQIWIDDDILSDKEIKFILVHELHERRHMCRGKNYHTAHKLATKIEDYCRKHPSKTDAIIHKEIDRNNSLR